MVPDPLPLAYAVYAFINVDNCERPLMLLEEHDFVHRSQLPGSSLGDVVVVRLEHFHNFIDSLDNHSIASVPDSCRRRRPPGNAVSEWALFSNVQSTLVV